MAKLTKLIDYAYLKETCDLPQNLSDDEFEHKILRAQDTLKMLMGAELYNAYYAAFEANDTSSYTALKPYLDQYLAWQTYEYWVHRANFKVTRGGFRVHQEENSAPATDIQMAGLIKEAKQEAQKYKKFLVDYLEENYPLSVCADRKIGNSFHISAVKKHREDCGCRKCRCV